MKPEEFLRALARALIEKKGINVLALDVRGLSDLGDYFLIAEGNVERHVKALAGVVEETAKACDEVVLRHEGMNEGEWVVLDCITVVVHLFTPSMRDRYRLEEIWKAAKLVELNN